MIPEPNLEGFVFIRVLHDIENFAFDEMFEFLFLFFSYNFREIIRMEKDSIYLMPFDKIKTLYEKKLVTLM
jgi:hypothetical protein